LAILLSLFLAVYAGKDTPCNAVNGSTTYLGSSGAFGCCGFSSSGQFRWIPPLGAVCSFKILDAACYYDNMFLGFYNRGGRTAVNRWTKQGRAVAGTKTWTNFTLNATDVAVVFDAGRTDNCDTKFWVTYVCEEPPKVWTVQSAVVYTAKTQPTGGFTYVTLNPRVTVGGASLVVQAETKAYQGLKPPQFFMAQGYLPVLESYDLTNTSVRDGSGYKVEMSVKNPANGFWVVGLFPYGRYANAEFTLTWKFNFPQFVNGETETGVLKGPATEWTRMIELPLGAKNLLIEYSREEPGGQTDFYVGSGFVPTNKEYTATKTTREQSFGDFLFPDPFNVADNKKYGNPGVFVVKAFSYDATAGFLMRATWEI
jgi:hypothetical protein